jgi:hypothetical protein
VDCGAATASIAATQPANTAERVLPLMLDSPCGMGLRWLDADDTLRGGGGCHGTVGTVSSPCKIFVTELSLQETLPGGGDAAGGPYRTRSLIAFTSLASNFILRS